MSEYFVVRIVGNQPLWSSRSPNGSIVVKPHKEEIFVIENMLIGYFWRGYQVVYQGGAM